MKIGSEFGGVTEKPSLALAARSVCGENLWTNPTLLVKETQVSVLAMWRVSVEKLNSGQGGTSELYYGMMSAS
jgi:hypothetical protein